MSQILLVEDLTSDAILFREALRDVGMLELLTIASDGEAALELLHQQDPLPELLLLDLNLPRKNGRELLDEIRRDERLALLPVIIVTTSISPEDVEFAYRHRANAYVRKPNGFHALAAVAMAIRDFWLRSATLPAPRMGL